jgi:phosphate uptake regulator
MFQLDKRKLQRHNQTYYVSIPISWVRNHSLGASSIIKMVVIENNKLILEPSEAEDGI